MRSPEGCYSDWGFRRGGGLTFGLGKGVPNRRSWFSQGPMLAAAGPQIECHIHAPPAPLRLSHHVIVGTAKSLLIIRHLKARDFAPMQ